MSAPTVAARRRAKRAARKAVSLASVPGTPAPRAEAQDNRPTPERMAKGEWVVGSATRVQRDVASTPLHRAHVLGAISTAMRDAGDAYLALRTAAIRIRCGAGQRDSLDLMPRGGGETSPEYEARVLIKDAQCSRALGYELRGAAEAFVVDGLSLGRFDMRRTWWRDTHAALVHLVLFFGIPEGE